MINDGQVEALRAAHRDSHPMGNIHHGTPENPDWGTFCVECKQSWPCEVVRLLDSIERIVAAERAAAWDEGHRLGEALAYNAVGDVLWQRHHDVIGRSDYRERRAARAEALPHWDQNPYRDREAS